MDERFELKNEHEAVGDQSISPPEDYRMNLQLFASEIDMMDVVFDLTDKKRIFATLDTSDAEDGEGEDENEELDDEEGTDDPLFIPRLTVTDRNLPHTDIGDVVVKDLDGNLYSVSVNNDGEAQEEPFQISTDNIEDGCISGAKLEENTITSRELDMEEIFADTALLNEMLAENIDSEALFANESFQDLFDDRVAQTAILRKGDAMEGPLTLSGDPTSELDAATKQYVDGKVSKAGDTMTGPLTLPGNPSAALEATPKQYVDSAIQASIQNAWAGYY